MLAQLLDIVYPPHCCVCGSEIERQHADPWPHSLLCRHCFPSASDELLLGRSLSLFQQGDHRYCPKCQEPFTPGLGTSSCCLHCQLVPPPWDRLRSLWPYRDHLEEIIKAYKYGHRWSLGTKLATALANFIRRVYPDSSWDAVVPVPNSNLSLRKRGFSPTAVISLALAKHLDIPCQTRWLRSSRRHIPQASLRYVERWENAQSSFNTVLPQLSGIRLLLVDDVVTTGSTLQAAAAALRSAGVQHIDAVTLARSQHFRQSRFLLLENQLAQQNTGTIPRKEIY